MQELIAQVRRELPRLSVRRMCSAVGISRAQYYRQRTRPAPLAPEAARLRLRQLARRHPTCGYRYLTWYLRQDGHAIGHKRVRRWMREDRLVWRARRRRPWLGEPAPVVARPNLARPHSLTRVNQLWVADFTYFRVGGQWAFLAIVLDAWSRRCVGWAISLTADTTLARTALAAALRTRAARGVIHHSDQGSQYTATAYQTLLADHGVQPSFSRPARPGDNAIAEAFMCTLKREEIHRNEYLTLPQAHDALAIYIERYNTARPHSALGYMPPARFERDNER